MELSHSYPSDKRSTKRILEQRFGDCIKFLDDMPEDDIYWQDHQSRDWEGKPEKETIEELTDRICQALETVLDRCKDVDCKYQQLI